MTTDTHSFVHETLVTTSYEDNLSLLLRKSITFSNHQPHDSALPVVKGLNIIYCQEKRQQKALNIKKYISSTFVSELFEVMKDYKDFSDKHVF